MSIIMTKLKWWAGAELNRRPPRCQRGVIAPRPPAQRVFYNKKGQEMVFMFVACCSSYSQIFQHRKNIKATRI